MTKRDNAIQMSVAEVGVDPSTARHGVVLKDADNRMSLPICMGELEAASIIISMRDAVVDRPLTHDLLQNMLRELGGVLESVELSDVKDDTCYALLHIRAKDRPTSVDCRPSDAIVLAIKNSLPIYVRKTVLETCGEMSEHEEQAPPAFSPSSKEKMAEMLRNLPRKAFKYKT